MPRFVAERLRAAGCVLLGKANLSEWANFRSSRSSSGWSGVGGQTCNPYVLDRNPCDALERPSDSLAMHLAIAQGVPVTAFFAPTSAAEIELYGRGEKVLSTAPDYCSYRPDADNSSLTTERLLAATLRCLGCSDASGSGSGHAARVTPGG